ncbi:MAG TPA: hypothetical protein VFZ17_10225, partial [Acidimicrobiia bacterium]|nr:hypothetical protein [Acidimicrobiia bacterium]
MFRSKDARSESATTGTRGNGEASLARRTFLRRGGLAVGSAGLATTLYAGAAGAQVTGQAIDYTYLPVGPGRVYDSRNGDGPLNLNQERV